MSTSQQLQQAFQYIKNGQQQEAAQILVPIVRAEPNNADAWWLLANAVTNGEQQRRALEKVLSLRPGDERAQKKLSQLTGAPTPPPPSSVAPTVMIPTSQMQQQIQAQSDPFANDPFADIPASSGTDPFGQPASSYTTTRTTTSYSSAQQQPPGAYPPSYGTPNPYGAPSPYGAPPPIAAPPPKKRGCNCCLVVFILMLVAVIACVGVILVGGASVTNSIFGGDPVSVLLGTSRPAADSLFGQALGTAGVGSISELLGTTTAVFGEFGEDASALATQAAATMNASGFSGDANAMMTQAVQTANALGFSGDANAMMTQAVQTANALGFSGDANAMMTQAAGTLAAMGGSPGTLSTDAGAPLQAAMYTNRGALAFDANVAGNIAGGSGDLWTFEGSAGQTVIIEMNEDKDSGLDPLVLLFGPDNLLITSDDDGGDTGFNSRLEFELPANGTYSLVATSFDSNGGAYTLIIRQG